MVLQYRLHCYADIQKDLDRLFRKNLFFVRIYDERQEPIAYSDIQQKYTTNPNWNPIILDSTVCGGATLKVVVHEFGDDGQHEIVGSFTVTLEELSNIKKAVHWDLLGPKKNKSKGKFYISRVEKIEVPNQPIYSIEFKAEKLSKHTPANKLCPFLMIYKTNSGGGIDLITKTEYQKQTIKRLVLPMTDSQNLYENQTLHPLSRD